MPKNKKQYQIHLNGAKTGPKFGTMRAAKKWLGAQVRKSGASISWYPSGEGQGFAIEDEPSRFINAPDCPLLHGPYYTGILYHIKEV